MTKKHLILLALPLLLIACKPKAPVTVDETAQEQPVENTENLPADENFDENEEIPVDESQIEAEQELAGDPNATVDETEDNQEGQYAGFVPEILLDGTTKVLFFHASWCPICKSADEKLQQW